jgi:hypothetical protein
VVVSGIPLSDFPTFRRLIPGTRDELKIATKIVNFDDAESSTVLSKRCGKYVLAGTFPASREVFLRSSSREFQ